MGGEVQMRVCFEFGGPLADVAGASAMERDVVVVDGCPSIRQTLLRINEALPDIVLDSESVPRRYVSCFINGSGVRPSSGLNDLRDGDTVRFTLVVSGG